jgi:nucleotide-binding universal stress UspA family protein
MFKTVLVPQTGCDADRNALQAANILLRPAGGTMECLYVHDDAAAIVGCVQTDVIGLPVATPELVEAINENSAGQRAAAKKAFAVFCKEHGVAVKAENATGISASWRELSENAVSAIARESAYHDAIVMALTGNFAEPTPQDIGTIVVSSGRPLILIPPAASLKPTHRIAIAWKETPEAARAVTFALPLLKQAKEVFILSTAENGDAQKAAKSARKCAAYLQTHDIHSESLSVEPEAGSASSAIFSEASRRGCDLLVMGAYGHGRLREFVFGGFTRAALFEAAIPVLLAH